MTCWRHNVCRSVSMCDAQCDAIFRYESIIGINKLPILEPKNHNLTSGHNANEYFRFFRRKFSRRTFENKINVFVWVQSIKQQQKNNNNDDDDNPESDDENDDERKKEESKRKKNNHRCVDSLSASKLLIYPGNCSCWAWSSHSLCHFFIHFSSSSLVPYCSSFGLPQNENEKFPSQKLISFMHTASMHQCSSANGLCELLQPFSRPQLNASETDTDALIRSERRKVKNKNENEKKKKIENEKSIFSSCAIQSGNGQQQNRQQQRWNPIWRLMLSLRLVLQRFPPAEELCSIYFWIF